MLFLFVLKHALFSPCDFAILNDNARNKVGREILCLDWCLAQHLRRKSFAPLYAVFSTVLDAEGLSSMLGKMMSIGFNAVSN